MDKNQSDYIDQHYEDAVKAGLEWFWPEDERMLKSEGGGKGKGSGECNQYLPFPEILRI